MSVPKGVAGNAAQARKTRKNNRPLEDEKKASENEQNYGSPEIAARLVAQTRLE
jgi:hypothetical protein